MSMDFVYDLKDKLDEQEMEYLIMVVKHTKDEEHIDTFYAIKQQETQGAICACMENLCDKWAKGEEPEKEILISEEPLSDWTFEIELPEDSPFNDERYEDENEKDDEKDDDEDKK